MTTIQRASDNKPTVQLFEDPDEHLLQQIAKFEGVEADWFTTSFEFSISRCTVAVVRDENGAIVCVGSINKASPNNYWIGNIVVAIKHRKQGWASTVVNTLVEYAANERHSSRVMLLASPSAISLYWRLGFSVLPSMIVTEYDRPPSPPPPPSNAAVLPNASQFTQACDLFFTSSGVRQDRMLREIFERDKLCAVVEKNGTVVACAWARRTANYARDNKPCVMLGPVVATSPDFAIQATAEILRMEFRGRNEGGDCCLRITTLLLDKGYGEGGKLAFKALGFKREYDLPVMVKGSGDGRDGRGGLDFETATEQYLAIAGWDFG